MTHFDDTTNESEEYKAFVDKFKPKKTTDDCYTPPNIYNAVLAWAQKEYNLRGRPIIRPFYPGGNYANEAYPKDCVVIDNPPFSILSQICKFYDQHGIDYFLFAPELTLFGTNRGESNYVLGGESITYENGAVVNTGFVTNMGVYKIILDKKLAKAIRVENEKNTKSQIKLLKYEYPDNVVTAPRLKKIARRGIDLRIHHSECAFIKRMDSQRRFKKQIFGGGFLLAEKAAAEKAAAEKAAAEKAAAKKAAAEKAPAEYWQLSDREYAIIKQLGEASQRE